MLETMLAVSMLGTPIVTYFLAKRSVRNGIIAAYEDIMGDIMSEETVTELRTITRAVMQSVTGSINKGMPQMDFEQVLPMILLGIFKDKIPFLKNLLPSAPQQPQTPEIVYDPSRMRRQ